MAKGSILAQNLGVTVRQADGTVSFGTGDGGLDGQSFELHWNHMVIEKVGPPK